jgi:hypothetical protein
MATKENKMHTSRENLQVLTKVSNVSHGALFKIWGGGIKKQKKKMLFTHNANMCIKRSMYKLLMY